MYNEVQKQKAAERAKKCLKNNYKRASINVRNEVYEEWQKYAEYKGLSIRGLIIESVEKAMKADGFDPSPEKDQKK